MPHPVAQDSREQKSLRHNLDPAVKLAPDRERGIDHPLNGAGCRAECGQNSKADQNPPHEQPAVLLHEKNFPERVKYEGKNQSPNRLEQGARHDDWIAGLPHP